MTDRMTRQAPRLAPWPQHDDDEVEAVAAVLRSGKVNYWTGEENARFESAFASYAGVDHAIALANGTLAIDLALIACGIGPGDDVIVTPRSYFASVSSVILAGARPVFADVDPDSQNITPASIAAVLTPATRAVMPVHLAGWPCDMPGIMALAKDRNLRVIEDCAQAHGARIGDRAIGSFGDAAAFSFCQDKIMTTGGEGGLMLTHAPELWRRAWAYKDHGKSYDTVHRSDHPPGFRWLHESIGSNFRMTGMQAEIGRLQLQKLDRWVALRRRNAGLYRDVLGDLPALRIPAPPADIYHAFYKFYCFVRPEALKAGWSRDRILHALHERGVAAFSGSCPEIYLEKAIVELGLAPSGRLPVARALGETSLMFLVHPTLSEAQVLGVADEVRSIVTEATCNKGVSRIESA